MPKASTTKRHLLTIRGSLPEVTVKVKTTTRARNKSGRVTSAVIGTAHDLVPSEPNPTPPPPLPDIYPEDPASEDETNKPVLPSTRKGPSRAVSVSFLFHNTHWIALNQARRSY